MSAGDPELRRHQESVENERSRLSSRDEKRNIRITWGLLLASLLLYITWGFWLARGIGAAAVLLDIVRRLVIVIPAGVASCFVAAKLLKTSFGMLGTALLKLATLVVVSDAVHSISFEMLDQSFGTLPAFIAGFLLTLIIYFWLLAWLFELVDRSLLFRHHHVSDVLRRHRPDQSRCGIIGTIRMSLVVLTE